MLIRLVIFPSQASDDIAMARIPVTHEALVKLGALRMQFLEGDCEVGSYL